MLRDLFSLFPAYAGVIPRIAAGQLFFETFPRIRGGDPDCTDEAGILCIFSPHTRG